jgi:hypothetical protein
MTDDEFIELFVKWKPSASIPAARQWFEQRNLTLTPMKAGALLTGSKSQIEQAFAVSLDDTKPAGNLPIPQQLHDHVETITIMRPRSYHRQ